ncbi:MAG TPA: hypothetical protein VII56_09610 [Rhizomicrobium sp.]
MSIESDRQVLLGLLRNTGTDRLPGKLLYSGLGTLKPGKLYLLGYNPGGDALIEQSTVSEHLSSLTADWNEYLDAKWRRSAKELAAGTALLQKRIQNLLQVLSLPVREVCASNIVFARSARADDLSNSTTLEANCWPVHQWILERVQPKLILGLGNDVFDALLKQAEHKSVIDETPSDHADWMCRACELENSGRKYRVVSIPHLSVYKIEHRQRVLDWLRQQIE